MAHIDTHRDTGSKAAIVFVHGFTGKSMDTWADFPALLASDPAIGAWDVFSLGYPTRIFPGIPGWSGPPGIQTLATDLCTTLSHAPLADRRAIAIIAHSMGGLVAQRAILDNPELAGRVSHLLLFGTPSAGLEKADRLSGINEQIRDMGGDSEFIRQLMTDRARWFIDRPPFTFLAVAGNLDRFVPPGSSIDPFPPAYRRVVDGDHLSIVKPADARHKSVCVAISALVRDDVAPTAVDRAAVAVEQRAFQNAVDLLYPLRVGLDETAAVDLALALDGLGRAQDALDVMEATKPSDTDALGVLGGRLKRRWLVGRQTEDWQRARALYGQALSIAEAAGEHDQAYYHAINIAFLELMKAPRRHGVPRAAAELAEQALEHCGKAADTMWREATMAEAQLILGDIEGASIRYAWAIGRALSPREVQSMYSQALDIAERIYGTAGVATIERTFA